MTDSSRRGGIGSGVGGQGRFLRNVNVLFELEAIVSTYISNYLYVLTIWVCLIHKLELPTTCVPGRPKGRSLLAAYIHDSQNEIVYETDKLR